MIAVFPGVFAGPTADNPAANDPNTVVNQEFVTSDELQTRLLNTLDNAQGVADGIGMTAILGDQIEAARASVLSATPQELEEIPPSLYNSLKIIEVGSGQLRLAYDPELRNPEARSKDLQKSSIQKAGQTMTIQSAGPDYDDDALDDPAYPNGEWDFSFEGDSPSGDANDVDSGEGDGDGFCAAPGYTYSDRVISMNTAVVANAVNDIAGHFCDWTVVVIGGGNISPLCVVTQVVASIATGIDDNMALCNEHMGAAEVSATWEGLKTVHGNVQHVHDDLADVDTDLAAHDSNIDSDLAAHDTHIDGDLAAHDSHIDSDLAAHDTNIANQLSAHDTHINADLEQHDEDVKGLLGGVQQTLDEQIELRKVHMQVLQLEQRKRYLVTTKEAGIAIGVIVESVEVFNESTDAFQAIPGAVVTELEPGLYDVALNIGPQEPDKVFRIRVRHDEAWDHFGEIVFHRTSTASSN
jgi:hypothetical protein